MKLFFEETNEEVALPQGLLDIHGREWIVLNVETPATQGRSGKLRAHEAGETWVRFFYPQVFRCYIAEEPRV